jgi:hypothetical protein
VMRRQGEPRNHSPSAGKKRFLPPSLAGRPSTSADNVSKIRWNPFTFCFVERFSGRRVGKLQHS